MSEDRGSHDVFRMDGAYRNNFLDFGDRSLRGHSHDGIEISCSPPISQIPQFIGGLRLDQRIVRANRQFEDAAGSFEETLFLSRGDFGADAHRGVETLQAHNGGPPAPAQNDPWSEVPGNFLC